MVIINKKWNVDLNNIGPNLIENIKKEVSEFYSKYHDFYGYIQEFPPENVKIIKIETQYTTPKLMCYVRFNADVINAQLNQLVSFRVLNNDQPSVIIVKVIVDDIPLGDGVVRTHLPIEEVKEQFPVGSVSEGTITRIIFNKNKKNFELMM